MGIPRFRPNSVIFCAVLLAGAWPPAARADIVSDPIAVDFGDVGLVRFGGGADAGRARFFVEAPVAIRNAGTSEIEVNVTISDDPHFSIAAERCGVIPSGGSCPIVVRYAPLDPGGHGAALSVRASDGEEILVPLWGDAVEVTCTGSECDAPLVDFGGGRPGESRTRAIGFVNETGGDVFASAAIDGSAFNGPIAPPAIVPDGGEASVSVTCAYAGEPGYRKGTLVWNLPTPILPVVRAVRIALLAEVVACLEPRGSALLPEGFAAGRKGACLPVAIHRATETSISRKLLVTGTLGGRQTILACGIRHRAADASFGAWQPVTLGGRHDEPFAGMLSLDVTSPREAASGLPTGKRLRARALAVSRRYARAIDLAGSRVVARRALDAPFGGVLVPSKLYGSRAYAVRRLADGPVVSRLRLKTDDGGVALAAPRLTLASRKLPALSGRRALKVRAMAAVPVRASGGAWREKLLVAARYARRGAVEDEKVLLLLGKREGLEARLQLPPRLGDITSLAVRRKKAPLSCLEPRQEPGIHAVLGTRTGRLLECRAERDAGTGEWTLRQGRRAKLPHDVRQLLWKGQEVFPCGEAGQDLIVIGAHGISVLETSGRLLETAARRKIAAREILSASRPRFTLEGRKEALYAFEDGPSGGRVLAMGSCIGDGRPGPRSLEKPIVITGDLLFVAHTKAGADAPVTLDAFAFDPAGAPLSYSWTSPGIEFDDPTSPTPTGRFPPGETTVYLVVRDGPADGAETRESDPRIIRVLVIDSPDTVCGDANEDRQTDISDGIALLSFLFLGSGDQPPLAAADVNGDGQLDISDPIYLLSFLFLGGADPVCPLP